MHSLELLEEWIHMKSQGRSTNAWLDDVDLWPGITYIHLGMYLLVTPSWRRLDKLQV